MSKPLVFRLLLALVLAWSGGAAQLHALSHAQHDLASAASEDKAPSPLKHSTDRCLIVHALDGTAAVAGALLSFESCSQIVASAPVERSGANPVLAFRSRAPPILS